MKKIILLLVTIITLIGITMVVWEENQIEKIYILDK